MTDRRARGAHPLDPALIWCGLRRKMPEAGGKSPAAQL